MCAGLPAAVALALACVPLAQAAGQKPLGAVEQAHAARMDHENAAAGTTIYAGDSFATEAGGILRMRLGSSQLSLESLSAAVVSQGAQAARVKVGEGAVRFSSSPASGSLEIETPIALVRGAAGRAAAGEVTLLGPKSIRVSAEHGALVIEREGEIHTIDEGKSYDVSLDSAEPPQPALPAAAAAAAQHGEGAGTSHTHHGRLIFDAVLIGSATGVAYCLWGTTESPSGFCH